MWLQATRFGAPELLAASQVPDPEGADVSSISSVSITWDDQDRPEIKVEYAEKNGSAPSAAPEQWLTVLAERLPDKSAKYLRKLLELNEAKEFVSLGELAAELGVEKKEVDGWNRNLGRSIKAVVRDRGFLRPELEDGTAQVFDLQWDEPNNRWLYTVPAKFRARLIENLDA
jgi:alpha-glucosidase (family GH31 glycosyl hydrolase)